MGIVHAKETEIKHKLPQAHINYEECDDTEAKTLPLDVPARVDKIHIDGMARTKDDFADKAVRDIFQAKTFEEVLLYSHKARLRLEQLYLFRNISVYIDVSRGPGSTRNTGLEVTFQVKEYKRIVGGVNTQVGNNEGSLIVGLKAPNVFGRGERVQVEYSYGSRRTNNFNLSFIKPFIGKFNPVFTASLYQCHGEYPSSGYKELDQGLMLDLGFNTFPSFLHNLRWDAQIRQVGVLSRASSFEVLENSGTSLKSSLAHILSIDLRDELIFPTCGSLLQLTTELAGIGGDVGFLKNHLYLQSNFTVVEDFVLQGTFSAGILTGISNDMKIGLTDMFYIGGPLSVRGFQMRGIGPHADGDALGSNSFWAAGLHLFAPLPFRPGKGGFGELFRTHLFINAGNVSTSKSEDEESQVKQLMENIRLAAGIGIAVRLGQMARFEINYCIPALYNDKEDQLNQGIQFGIGVQFV